MVLCLWPSGPVHSPKHETHPRAPTDLLEVGQLDPCETDMLTYSDTLVWWKMGGVVKNLIFRIGKMMINHRVSCAIFAIKPFWLLIKTNMLWFSHQHGLNMFDCIKAQPQIYGIIHRPWPIPRISHCSLLISKRNPSRLFGVYSTTGRAVAPGLFHHRATVVIWGHNPPHRPPTVPVQW